MTADAGEAAEAAEAAEQKRARDTIFGDALPDSTRDDRQATHEDLSTGTGGSMSRDDELLRDVPPHHG